MKSLSVSGRLHAGEDTMKDARGQNHSRQCIRVCNREGVEARKKIEVRAGHGVIAFHITNKHIWVCRRVMKSVRSPSYDIRVWKRHRTQMNPKLW